MEKYPGLLKGWGMGGPHGLFKRSGKEDLQQWDHIPIGTRGWWGLSGPHGLFKKSGVMEPIKRGAYSFGKILCYVQQLSKGTHRCLEFKINSFTLSYEEPSFEL